MRSIVALALGYLAIDLSRRAGFLAWQRAVAQRSGEGAPSEMVLVADVGLALLSAVAGGFCAAALAPRAKMLHAIGLGVLVGLVVAATSLFAPASIVVPRAVATLVGAVLGGVAAFRVLPRDRAASRLGRV